MKSNKFRVQLIGALKAFGNGQFKKSFNFTFMGSIKNYKKKVSYFFIFP